MAENTNAQSSAPQQKTVDPAFDCLAVTQVQVFPFKEGPSLGHLKGLAQIVLNDQMVIRGAKGES